MANKIRFCKHCDSLFWAKRSTAKFCSDSCKMKNHRGTVPQRKLDIVTDAELTDYVAKLATVSPRAFNEAKSMVEKYGVRSMRHAVLMMKYYLMDVNND